MIEERPSKPKGNKPQQGHPIPAEEPQPLRRLSWCLEEYIWGSMTDVAFSYDNYQGVASIPFIEFEAEPIYPKGWYNLNGQKVGEECPTQKGIYIHNGKKMVVE